MMGMYARTVGLRSVDCSLPGQPFGNHFGGLAYRPGELAQVRHHIGRFGFLESCDGVKFCWVNRAFQKQQCSADLQS
jgi:hypothetical protein